MDEVERLLKIIKRLIEAKALEVEFENVEYDETDGVLTVEQLNDYLEESMTYWE